MMEMELVSEKLDFIIYLTRMFIRA